MFGKKKENFNHNSGNSAHTKETKVVNTEKGSKNESCTMTTLISVNELLQFMTNLDYVKEMILDAGQQKEMVESVAASSEEMSSATEDISNFVQDSSKTMNDVMEKTATSLEKIYTTFNEIEKNINETNVVKDIMQDVTSEMKRINEMVNVIKSVAAQTNLLSLNASIEAARAGVHGRGFAVVADEVKNLAQSTSQQVELIQEIVDSLNEKIKRASSEIDKVITTFADSRGSIDEATNGIKGINDDMGTVGDSFTEISANVEEQSAATEEMSSSLMLINDKAVTLLEESNRTGKAFFDISLKIDEVRLRSVNASKNISNEVMIELSITDHLMWKWLVYNMILGYVKLSIDAVGNHHQCRLGHWLATLDSNDSSIRSIVNDIDEPHSKIHEIAKKSITEYENGNVEGAERMLKEIESYSNVVVGKLNDLKGILK